MSQVKLDLQKWNVGRVQGLCPLILVKDDPGPAKCVQLRYLEMIEL